MDTHPLTLDAFEQFLDRNVQLMEDYLCECRPPISADI